MYRTVVLADSSNHGYRLTTLELCYPRFIHAELLTHRLFSRNSASSRAIPTHKLLEQVRKDPVYPLSWGANQSGMSADTELSFEAASQAKKLWTDTLYGTIKAVEAYLASRNALVHKQVINRLLEPFLWHTSIVSATDWKNFLTLRLSPGAQPEMQHLARGIKEVLAASKPVEREWHLPLLRAEDQSLDLETQKQLSVARCARVSYLTHDGVRDPEKDLELYNRLLTDGHMSPFEHVAQAMTGSTREILLNKTSNFMGWTQYRHLIERDAYASAW